MISLWTMISNGCPRFSMIIPILNILILINCAYPSGIWCRTARIWPSCWGSHCAQSFPNGSWTFWSISFVTFKHRRYSLNSFAAIARKVSKKLINNLLLYWLIFYIFSLFSFDSFALCTAASCLLSTPEATSLELCLTFWLRFLCVLPDCSNVSTHEIGTEIYIFIF